MIVVEGREALAWTRDRTTGRNWTGHGGRGQVIIVVDDSNSTIKKRFDAVCIEFVDKKAGCDTLVANVSVPTKMSLPEAPTPAADLTTLLHAWRAGSGIALNEVIERVYGELKKIAARRVGQAGGIVTLSPTELLHEALVSIMPTPMDFKNRAHFFAVMSLAIRSILVDHARARSASKRGGDFVRVTLTNADNGEESQALDLLAIDQALSQLEALDPRCGQIMHLTYFAGLEQDEIATLLEVSVSTVTRDLKFARGWVTRALANDA